MPSYLFCVVFAGCAHCSFASLSKYSLATQRKNHRVQTLHNSEWLYNQPIEYMLSCLWFSDCTNTSSAYSASTSDRASLNVLDVIIASLASVCEYRSQPTPVYRVNDTFNTIKMWKYAVWNDSNLCLLRVFCCYLFQSANRNKSHIDSKIHSKSWAIIHILSSVKYSVIWVSCIDRKAT